MARSSFKLGLLLWKNYKLQVRHPLQTVVEVLIPVLFTCLIVVVRSLVAPEYVDTELSYPPFSAWPNFSYRLPPATNSSIPENPVPENSRISLPCWGESATCSIEFKIAWSPRDESSEEFTKQAKQVMEVVGRFPYITPEFYKNAKEMEKDITQPGKLIVDWSDFINLNATSSITVMLAGVVLEDLTNSTTKTPTVCSRNLQVTIRFPGELRLNQQNTEPTPYYNWRTHLLFPMYQVNGPRQKNETDGGHPKYRQEGFLAIQSLMALGVAQICSEERNRKTDEGDPSPAINMSSLFQMLRLRRFSYPQYTEDLLLEALQSFISLMIMLSFVYTCIATVKVITAEKERQLKEAMKIMGLPSGLHWLAWFIKTFVFLLVSVLLIVVLLKVKWYPNSDMTVFTYSSGTVLFVFMVLFMITTTCFCFMISVFFSKANTAATIAGLAWFLSYAPYSFLQREYETMSLATKLVVCLFSNTAMAYGFQILVMYEGTGVGLSWGTMMEPATQDDNLAMGHVMLMLVADAALYLVVTLYVEAVFPGAYGVPKPWYFLFQKSFWFKTKPKLAGDMDNSKTLKSEDFEKEPQKLPVGIQIRNLRKVFSGNKVAVDNLSLNMYEGQITVLLGHNGAGKTTTMSMLTGMYTPSRGTAVVGGYDICTDIDGVRDSLGLCPQHNVLFDELTVREHLYFFAKLKGLDGSDLEEEIKKYVALLQLEPKEHAQSHTLSGGMKRKLSAGVALCGKSKVVMFDEPTSGMDPAARRALWDLLQEEKAGRTVLLSTHFMDEADLLGDRIAIMAGGHLKCCGSSFFLKKRYGAGYRLIIVKDTHCQSALVTALLRHHLPGLSPSADVGSELSYQLEGEHAPRFEPMLRELEDNRERLAVLSYGVSLTTMEEVFMKVGKDQEVTQENGVYKTTNGEAVNGQLSVGLAGDYRPSPVPTPPARHFSGEAMFFTDYQVQVQSSDSGDSLLHGWRLTMNQLHGMLMKKMLTLLRAWILFLITALLPAIFLIIVIVMSRTWQTTRDLPGRDITLETYSESYTMMAVTNLTANFTQNTGPGIVKYLAKRYENLASQERTELQIFNSNNATNKFEQEILKMYRENLSLTRHAYIVGVSYDVYEKNEDGVNMPYITAWFNDLPYHAVPLALNMVINSVLDLINVTMSLVNHPVPYTQESQMMLVMDGNNIGFQIAFNVGFSMAFVAAYYTMFPVKERMTKAKHLQFVSGMEVLVFWGTHLIVDGLSFLLPSLGVVITLACFQEEGFAKPDDLGRMFAILICFGWAMLPLMYLSSFLFTIPSSGYTRLTMFNIFTGCAAFLVVTILQIPMLELEDVAEILDWILMLIPHYCLCDAIRYEYTNYVYLKLCDEYGCELGPCCKSKCEENNNCLQYSENYFAWKQPGIGRNIVFFLGMGCVFNLVLLLVEFHIFECFRISRKHHPKVVAVKSSDASQSPEQKQRDQEDSDVREEKDNIHSQGVDVLCREFSLVLRDVTKYYGNFLAVDHICIGIKKGECFGLLGVNGAGKTTTFKMMTGDEKISEGEAYLNGLNLRNDMKQVHQLIGYCPQFDALIEELTGRETLHMFCLLRGVKGPYIPGIVNSLADELLFTKHIDKKVKEYSGGNKRKLSTAVALIGEPPVVFLDEPTTGMDPVAKRHLWNVICKVRDSGTSIILTSHSMEECEALCTRLAIMVNGNFKCLGSTQHLKNKFAEGYTLIVKVKGTPSTITTTTGRVSLTLTNPSAFDVSPVKSFIESSFPGASLREEYMGLLTYYVPSSRLKWSQMFGMMERAKQDLNIEDYSLGQTSLEQVFLTFTKAQKTE